MIRKLSQTSKNLIILFLFVFSTVAMSFEANKIENDSEKFSFMLDLGSAEGDAEADRFGISARYNFPDDFIDGSEWSGRLYLELSASYWDGENGSTGHSSLFDFGVTPVFRLTRFSQIVNSFVEVGLGAHLHTEDGIDDENFDIPFAFGSHIGLGLNFGSRKKMEVMYRFQHLSNASLGDDNPGINFHLLQLGVNF